MSRFGLVALALLLPVSVAAADFKAPVSEVMAAATVNWQDLGEDTDTDTPPPYTDYFSEDFLKRLYSKDFVAKYKAAAKFPAYDDGDSPFDYDPVIGGQDSCALKDVTTTEGQLANGAEDVTVTFDNSHCFGERPAGWQPETLVFKMIEEDGRAVIDDIERPSFEEGASLKKEMVEIAEAGANGGNGSAAESPE
ncbi:hypothetical protein KYK30_04650 [Shinella yambaruensis]|uniref:Uncharacterized protein n=1 Tax=Shinella yambaruensis TaxID=415996 RepID=A0ABQ5ZGU2_9HYPH|nr:hypothetical protein [Shinella yambaruensis]MCJ8023884.1 hypothetical protein [Shinella yambaruensis]MCU7978966.1 hypothetical protein [Shinella yambaruensis]GLR51893.1 hypothetical protein GCM10007923_31040 [Shinella yambaruensis]